MSRGGGGGGGPGGGPGGPAGGPLIQALTANTQALLANTALLRAGGGGVAGGGGGGFGGGGNMLSQLLGGAMDPVSAGFTQLAQTITPFVQAFDPSAVFMFNEALYDLSAVIGSVLDPVLTAMTGIVRNVADQMMPLAAQLQPVFAQVSDALMGLANTGINLLFQAVQPLVPVFEVLGSMVSSAAVLGEAWLVIWGGVSRALIDFGKSLVGLVIPGDFADVWATVPDAMRTLAKEAILAAATLAKLAGFDSAVKGMINAMGGAVAQGGSVGFGAARNAQVTDALSFNRQLATSAAMATMGPAGQSDEGKWRDDVREHLKAIDGTQKSELGKLFGRLSDLVVKMDAVIAIIRALLKPPIERIAEQITRDPGSAAGLVDDVARGNVAALAVKAGVALGRWMKKKEE